MLKLNITDKPKTNATGNTRTIPSLQGFCRQPTHRHEEGLFKLMIKDLDLTLIQEKYDVSIV